MQKYEYNVYCGRKQFDQYFFKGDVTLTAKSRAKVIKDINDAMGYLQDNEMIELSLRVIGKLNN